MSADWIRSAFRPGRSISLTASSRFVLDPRIEPAIYLSAIPISPHSIKIRPATPLDAIEIARIHVETWRLTNRNILPEAHLKGAAIEKRAQGWKRNLLENRDSVLVAESTAVIVGWISFGACRDTGDAHEAEIFAIYIDAKTRRKGVGALLVQAAESRLLEISSASRISVWILERNAIGRSFYERLGYTRGAREKKDIIGGETFLALRYEKLIAQKNV